MESQGNMEEALKLYQNAVALNSGLGPTRNRLSWRLATLAEPHADLRDPKEALRLAEESCAITQFQDPVGLMSLAASQAALGQSEAALQTIQQAMDRAAEQGKISLMERCRQLEKNMKAGRPLAP